MARTKWSYSTAEIYRDRLDDVLSDWGDKGWELVTLTLIPPPKEADSGPDLFLAVFKIENESVSSTFQTSVH
jgi:hypothetical protein